MRRFQGWIKKNGIEKKEKEIARGKKFQEQVKKKSGIEIGTNSDGTTV